MPKPRRKVIRKTVKPAQSNAAIQKLLDVHSERKRNTMAWSDIDHEGEDWPGTTAQLEDDTFSSEDYQPSEMDFDTTWTEESRGPSQLDMIQSLSGHPPRYTVIFRGAATGSNERYKANLDVILSLKLYRPGCDTPERPIRGWQINDHEVMVYFNVEGYEQILRARVIRLGHATFHVIPCRLTPQALFTRLEDMDAADDIDVGEDDPRDPLVAASLIPGLRRSEYTHAINPRMYQGFHHHRNQLDWMKAKWDSDTPV